MTLYHHTCADSAQQLGRYGAILQPRPVIWADASLVWLTDNPDASGDDLGLSPNFSSPLICDRMQYRYKVVCEHASRCVRWLDSPVRDTLPAKLLSDLESFGTPDRWWVSERPLRAHRDFAYLPSRANK
jgi:hypothetical protein